MSMGAYITNTVLQISLFVYRCATFMVSYFVILSDCCAWSRWLQKQKIVRSYTTDFFAKTDIELLCFNTILFLYVMLPIQVNKNT